MLEHRHLVEDRVNGLENLLNPYKQIVHKHTQAFDLIHTCGGFDEAENAQLLLFVGLIAIRDKNIVSLFHT